MRGLFKTCCHADNADATLAGFFADFVTGRISCGHSGPKGADTYSWPLGRKKGAGGPSPSKTGIVDIDTFFTEKYILYWLVATQIFLEFSSRSLGFHDPI